MFSDELPGDTQFYARRNAERPVPHSPVWLPLQRCGKTRLSPKGGDLYAGAFDFRFVITEDNVVSGDYDVLLAYYQTNDNNYNVNAFELSSAGVLTLNRGGSVSLTDGVLTSESTMGSSNLSTFVDAEGTAYVLSTPGLYTVNYLGGTNGSAANLYLDGVKVAGFTGGNHNMNGAQQGGANLTFKVNSAYVVPEPTTATLSLLALAGLAARRRRK